MQFDRRQFCGVELHEIRWIPCACCPDETPAVARVLKNNLQRKTQCITDCCLAPVCDICFERKSPAFCSFCNAPSTLTIMKTSDFQHYNVVNGEPFGWEKYFRYCEALSHALNEIPLIRKFMLWTVRHRIVHGIELNWIDLANIENILLVLSKYIQIKLVVCDKIVFLKLTSFSNPKEEMMKVLRVISRIKGHSLFSRRIQQDTTSISLVFRDDANEEDDHQEVLPVKFITVVGKPGLMSQVMRDMVDSFQKILQLSQSCRKCFNPI